MFIVLNCQKLCTSFGDTYTKIVRNYVQALVIHIQKLSEIIVLEPFNSWLIFSILEILSLVKVCIYPTTPP